jgi:hypothetical protein
VPSVTRSRPSVSCLRLIDWKELPPTRQRVAELLSDGYTQGEIARFFGWPTAHVSAEVSELRWWIAEQARQNEVSPELVAYVEAVAASPSARAASSSRLPQRKVVRVLLTPHAPRVASLSSTPCKTSPSRGSRSRCARSIFLFCGSEPGAASSAPLNSSGRCWTCADDDAEERREWRAWREYADRQQGMLGAIAEVAPVVCSKLELELLALDLNAGRTSDSPSTST